VATKNVQVIVVGDSRSAQAALKQLSATARTTQSGLGRLGGAIQTVGAGMTSVGRSMTRWVTLPIVGAGVAATKLATDFDQSMRNVNSIMGVSERELAKFSDQVLELSTRFPQDAKTLADGMYDIASSGFQGAEGLKVLEASARAASAGMTDTGTSAKAITAIMNAYGLAAEDAAHVSDVLFTGVDKGVLTFEELASSLGDYVGAASQLGVPLEQVVGAQAAMTLSGISAAEAATSLNNVMRSLLKPSEDMSDTLKDFGYNSGQAALEAEGLDGLIAKLSGTVGDDKDEWLKLFPEIRAARGAMALAANDGKNLSRVMEAMGTATGRTSEAFAEQAKGPAFQFTLALNRLKKVGIEVGNRLIPILLDDVIPAFERALDWWDGLSEGSKKLALKIAGITAVMGPFLRVFGPAVTLMGKAATKLPGVVGWLLKWAGIKSFPVPGGLPTGAPVPAPVPGGGKTTPVPIGGFGRIAGFGRLASLGIFGAAFAFGSISNEPRTDELALIEEYLARAPELRVAIHGVADAESALAADVAFLNRHFAEQGSEVRVNAGAYRAAARSGSTYDDVITGLAPDVLRLAKRHDLSTDAVLALSDAFSTAQGITAGQKSKIAGLIGSLEELGAPLSDTEEKVLANYLAVGYFEGAMKLLKEKLAAALRPTKNYNAEVAQTEAAHLRAARAARAQRIEEQALLALLATGAGGPQHDQGPHPHGGAGRRQRRSTSVVLERRRFARDLDIEYATRGG